MTSNRDLEQMFAALDGTRIAGGCDLCDAYQVPSVVDRGVVRLDVFHDPDCPAVAERERNR